MKKHTERYNALPLEVREICSPIIAQAQITQLLIEKNRLKKRYYASLKEINDQIKGCEKHIELCK